MLVVVEGVDRGLAVALPPGAYRVVGRLEQGADSATVVVAPSDGRRLSRKDQERVAQHLKRRAEDPLALGARAAVAAFARAADIEVRDEAVSQTHAMVFHDEAGASVVDVASTNGTFVNGERRSESLLVAGDLLRVGETRFEVTFS